MAAVLRRMRGTPWATGLNRIFVWSGWGSDRDRRSAVEKHSDGQIKNEALFFIVCIIILFTLLVHSCWVGDEARLQQFMLQDSCGGNTAPIFIISILALE